MSEFKLLKEKEHSFLIKHPKGHEFEIAKAGLDKKVLSKIKSMTPVKMADGGIVPDPLAPESYSTPAPVVTSDNVGDGYYRAPDDASRAPASIIGDAAHAVGSGINSVYNAWNQGITQPIIHGVKDAATGLVSGLVGAPNADASTTAPASPSTGSGPIMTDAEKQAQMERQALAGSGPSPASTQGGQAQGMGAVDLPQGYKDAMGMQASGIRGMAQASKDAGDQLAQAQADAQAKQQAITDQYKSTYQKLDQDNDKFMQAYANGKIDPNRVWNDMGTGSKISAGIGMILSGIGSGMTGQPNLAMQVLDKTIDRDIDAQKSNLDKNRGLYAMNMEKYKNTQAAEAATRLQINSMLQSQIAQTAAKQQGAQAMANSQILLGGLKQQGEQLKTQLTGLTMARQAMSGGVPLNSPQDQYMNATNENYRKTAVPVGNLSYQARTEDDAKDLKQSEALFKPIQDDIALLKSLGPAAVTDPAVRARAQAAMARLGMYVNEFNGYKRFSDTDKETIAKQFNDPTAISSFFQGKGATNDTLQSLTNKMESERGKRLIGYKTYDSFKPAGRN